MFQALVKSTAAHDTQPLAFKALVKPSTRPSGLRLYDDAGLKQGLALVEEAGSSYFVLEQTAGEQVQRHVWPPLHELSKAAILKCGSSTLWSPTVL